tara:strand:- start:1438 stop:1704 length:267 start_codon:yes stop_codon:yes gene_type:complete
MPTATPRKRRTRKTTPAKPKVEVIKVTEPKATSVRPSTLLKSTDYINDIKVRLEIHNYEVNALVNDIKWGYSKVKDYVVTTYKKEFAK